MLNRKNCWDVMNCGRGVGEKAADKHAPCPAAISGEFNGGNGGIYRGRCCWLVAGTCCNGTAQGSFARKLRSCIYCHFFIQVQQEEGRDFVMAPNAPGGRNKR